MPKVPLYHKRYIYVHEEQREPFEAIDVHHVFVQKNRVRDALVLCTAVLILLAFACYWLLLKEGPGIGFFWSIMLSSFLVKSFYQKGVEKESVIVMPAFGVQLETHYRSGRIVRRFVPIGKILKPVLNECVTPVTCYWCLAFIVRGEADLMLVFQDAIGECSGHWKLCPAHVGQSEFVLDILPPCILGSRVCQGCMKSAAVATIELRPPAKILVPVWKALCAATDDMERTDEKADQ